MGWMEASGLVRPISIEEKKERQEMRERERGETEQVTRKGEERTD